MVTIGSVLQHGLRHLGRSVRRFFKNSQKSEMADEDRSVSMVTRDKNCSST